MTPESTTATTLSINSILEKIFIEAKSDTSNRKKFFLVQNDVLSIFS
jgi:hypothetical protein